MEDSYTELLAAWGDILPKLDVLEHDLVEELLTLARDFIRWPTQGENDKMREAVERLHRMVVRSSGARQGALQIALMVIEGVPFEVDDPEVPDEPLAFRCWRTVEHGYEVMDARLAADPSYRAFPRMEYSPVSTYRAIWPCPGEPDNRSENGATRMQSQGQPFGSGPSS